jgi:hypothetical protein
MDLPIGLDMISSTQLMNYERCPKSFYYNTFLGIELPQNQVHLRFGSAIHLALDNIYEQYDEKEGKNGWELADKSIVRKIFKNNFLLEHVDPETYGGTQTQVYEDMTADGLRIIDEYWDMKEILREKGVCPSRLEVQNVETICLPESGVPWCLPLRTTMDGMNEETNRIVDFKTSSREYDYLETRNSIQALSYVSAWYCRKGVIPAIDYVVLKKKVKKDKIQHLSIQYTVADLLAFDARAKHLIERIRMRDFDRPGKNHPHFCNCWKFEELLSTN